MAKMKTNHKHYSAGAVIWIIIKYFSLVFFSFVALLPIVSCVITAFKTDAEYQSTNGMRSSAVCRSFAEVIHHFHHMFSKNKITRYSAGRLVAVQNTG